MPITRNYETDDFTLTYKSKTTNEQFSTALRYSCEEVFCNKDGEWLHISQVFLGKKGEERCQRVKQMLIDFLEQENQTRIEDKEVQVKSPVQPRPQVDLQRVKKNVGFRETIKKFEYTPESSPVSSPFASPTSSLLGPSPSAAQLVEKGPERPQPSEDIKQRGVQLQNMLSKGMDGVVSDSKISPTSSPSSSPSPSPSHAPNLASQGKSESMKQKILDLENNLANGLNGIEGMDSELYKDILSNVNDAAWINATMFKSSKSDQQDIFAPF